MKLLKRLLGAVRLRDLIRVTVDAALVLLALRFAMLLRFDGANPDYVVRAESLLRARWGWLLLTHIICLVVFGVYRTMWRYGGVREYISVFMACTCAAVLNTMLSMMFEWKLPRSVLILSGIIATLLISLSRLAWVYVRENMLPRLKKTSGDRRIMIVGAGEGGLFALRLARARNMGAIVCLVDDDVKKANRRISGVPVAGATRDIPELAADKRITDIIVAIPSLTNEEYERIGVLCAQSRCRVKVLTQPEDMKDSGDKHSFAFKKLDASMFLQRDEVVLDMQGITNYVKDKTILVTGGGGSIGSEICRQLMRFSPGKLIVFDIYENNAYELQMELKRKYGADCPVAVVIGSIRDKKRLDDVMNKYKPTVVFHAAAHKHVPLMESSPAEAVKNNVFGTLNLLNSAKEHGVERLVQLSTDKAVNPTNVMGATKRVTEMLIQMFARTTDMKCMAVRFGNVLGSHGSVIPLFEQQILDGGPVTLTHADITRYFMTIPEAARLVLQTGALAKSGSIYVLDMGEPVRIYDLASKLIRFYGYEPGKDIDIRVTGLRPGEKLYEELMMETELNSMGRTAHDKILVAPPIAMDDLSFLSLLSVLRDSAERGDETDTIARLKDIVDTYHPRDEDKAS